MGRPGIEQGKIREVIDELDAEGKAISVTSIKGNPPPLAVRLLQALPFPA